jgi:cytidylate kinase
MAIQDPRAGQRHIEQTIPRTVTIDGPSAAGKSSVGYRIAQRLGYDFLDTGAMYRAITWLALERDVDPEDEESLAKLASEVELEIGPPPAGEDESSILLEGRDLTPHLRQAAVERAVSLVSRVAAVRQEMVEMQRRLAVKGPLVITGRDIGTVVLPNADLKIYLDASPGERARRRYQELVAAGRKITQDEVLAEIHRRDGIDQSRSTSPLRPADDAVIINTDGFTLDQVVQRILDLIKVER